MTTHVTTTKTLLCLPLALCAACDPQVGPDYQGEPVAEVRGRVIADENAPSNSSVAVLWLTSSEEYECTGPTLACGFGAGGDDSTDFECLAACGEPIECNEEMLAAWQECALDCGVLEADFSLHWEPCASGAVGAQVPITGSFPASFQLELFDAPPPEALLPTADGHALAFGWIMAVEEDADLVFDFTVEEGFDEILGISERHVIVYADSDVPADSPWGQYLGGAITAGYHLIEAVGGGVECDPGVPESIDTCYQSLVRFQPAPADLATEIELRFGPLWKLVVPL